MPRKLRVEFPGEIYHVMSRGSRRENISRDDVDRQDFLKTLAEACQKTGFQAGESGTPQAAAALDALCRAYWEPIYAYIRRQGVSPHDAQDLTRHNRFSRDCWPAISPPGSIPGKRINE
jgi:hypothetical protein